MALTSAAATKVFMGVPSADTSLDAFLAQVLPAIEAAFLKLIDRALLQATYTLYLSGNGRKVLLLPEYPVASVTSVHLDPTGAWGSGPSAFAAATLLVAGTDYALVKDGRDGSAEVGRLYRINGVWPGRWETRSGMLTAGLKPGAGNVRVVAVCGYATTPADVELAIWQICAQIQAQRATGRAISSESFEEYSISFEDIAKQLWQIGGPAQIVRKHRRLSPRHVVLG